MKLNSDYRRALEYGVRLDKDLYRREQHGGYVVFFCIIGASLIFWGALIYYLTKNYF